MLVSIIIVCSFIAYTPPRETFEIETNTCKELLIDYLQATTMKDSSRERISDFIMNELRLAKEELLAKHNIKMADLPEDVRSKLPDLSLDDVLTNFRRSVEIDFNGTENPSRSTCIIPITYMKRLQEKNNTNDIKIMNFMEGNSDEQNAIRNKGIDTSLRVKVCKIGNSYYPSNVVSSYSSDMNALIQNEKNARTQDGKLYLGCEYLPTGGMEKVKEQLKEIFQFADSDNIRRFNELIAEFKRTYDIRMAAKAKDEQTARRQEETRSSMLVQQEVAAKAKSELDVQAAITAKTVPPLTEAGVRYNVAYNNLITDITRKDGY